MYVLGQILCRLLCNSTVYLEMLQTKDELIVTMIYFLFHTITNHFCIVLFPSNSWRECNTALSIDYKSFLRCNPNLLNDLTVPVFP